jgi:hypothetical protein
VEPDSISPPAAAAPARPTPELARHAAEQLGRIHKAGWITGPDDPDARLFASAFMLFEATAEI